MKKNGFWQNKFYLTLLGLWALLYVLQAAFAPRGILMYLLAILYGVCVGTMLAIAYAKEEQIFLVVCGVSSLLQIILLLCHVPYLVTGTGGVSKVLLRLFYVPGGCFLSGAPVGWHWASVTFWGIILCGTVELLWKKVCCIYKDWWQELRAGK